ncbi:hypothetical protein HYY69_03695 [Candidatus Woesearchaeota archaeon]|nr:hypothetical protein [Candidatus Woesearchaeota archaeon]
MAEPPDEEILKVVSNKCSLETVIETLEPEFYKALLSLGVQFNDAEHSIDITNIDLTGSATYNVITEKYQQNPGECIEHLRDTVLYCWIKKNVHENSGILHKGRLLSIDSHLGLIDRLLWLSSELTFEETSVIGSQDQKVVIYELVTHAGQVMVEHNIVAPPKSAYETPLNQSDAETWNFVVAMIYINDINRRAFALGYAKEDIIAFAGHDPLGFPNKIKFKPQNIDKNIQVREHHAHLFVEPLNPYMQ